MGASVRARLLNLAKASGQSFDLVLTRFALERLLFRLSQSRYADRFVLKGAMLLMSWLAEPHRGTRDLDSRALVEIFSHPRLRESLAFRGSAALHKLPVDLAVALKQPAFDSDRAVEAFLHYMAQEEGHKRFPRRGRSSSGDFCAAGGMPMKKEEPAPGTVPSPANDHGSPGGRGSPASRAEGAPDPRNDDKKALFRL